MKALLRAFWFNFVLAFFNNKSIKINTFILGVMVFSLLYYVWQGKYYETANLIEISYIVGFISFVVPSVMDFGAALALSATRFLAIVREEVREYQLRDQSKAISLKRLSKILANSNTIVVKQVAYDTVDLENNMYEVFDVNGKQLRKLKHSDYEELRNYLVTQDVFLKEKITTDFGYVKQTTFHDLLHCEDGPSFVEFYRDGAEMKFLKEEYCFLDYRFQSKAQWEQYMEDYYFNKK